jgi:hypothetical protein
LKKTAVISLLVLTFFASCKRKDKEECTHASAEGTCKIQLNHVVGAEDFQFNTDFSDDFGNDFQFSRADWYFRVAGFVENDSTEIVLRDGYFKIDPSVLECNYGAVPAGALSKLTWGLGVDSVLNHGDPNTYSFGDALANQSPSMHWSWSSGYIFCVLEGRVDIDGNGSYDSGELFALHVGADANYRDGNALQVDASVPNNGEVIIPLNVDYAEFIDGIDLSADNSTHTMDNMPLAVRIANNFVKVLKLP